MYEARPAGFWIRAVALLIDAVVLSLVNFSLGLVGRGAWGASGDDAMLLRSLRGTFTLIFAAGYVTCLLAAGGQTIGKMVVGAHVVLVDGEPLPIGSALLRFLGYFVSSFTLGFGYLMAGLRRDKRALHDLIAGTRVERRLPPPTPSAVEPSDAMRPPVA